MTNKPQSDMPDKAWLRYDKNGLPYWEPITEQPYEDSELYISEQSHLAAISDIEAKYQAPTDNGIPVLDELCERFNKGEIDLCSLVCHSWNAALVIEETQTEAKHKESTDKWRNAMDSMERKHREEMLGVLDEAWKGFLDAIVERDGASAVYDVAMKDVINSIKQRIGES